MCLIFGNSIFILLIFALVSVQVSAVSTHESRENDLESNYISDIELGSVFEQNLLFSEIDPGIAEDSRLETVMIFNILEIQKYFHWPI